jgi:hypothetical protein
MAPLASRSPSAKSRRSVAGLTPRALLIGVLLVPTLCTWTLYTEIVAQSTELAVMSLSVGAVFALLVLLAINAALKRWTPRLAFTQAELVFIYIMQTVSIGISGVGMIQFLNIGLADIFRYATSSNGWTQFHPYLRSWAFPDPTQLRGYYLGESSFFTRAHLLAWLAPILVWTAFIVVLLGTMLCLNVILRRRWVEQERFTFPIVMLPLELTRQGGDREFFTRKGLWAGFLIAFSLEALAGVAHLFPSIPFLPLKPSDPRLDLSGLLTTPPWNAIGQLQLGFYPMAIGLTYFLPLDVSFSCWFFFVLRKMEDVTATALGFRDPGASMALARIPYIGEQAGGAFLGLALFSLWGMRGYLKEVWLTALRPGRGPLDDRNEPLSYRGALIGIAVGFCALAAFAMLLGLTAWLAVLFFALWFLIVITYTRLRAEAGLPWAFGPDMTPHQMITALTGTQTLGMQNMVALTQFQWIDLDYRVTAMPAQLEAMKLAGEARANQRQIFGVILLATVLAALSSWVAVLACYYKYGAATAHVDSWRSSMGSAPWKLLSGWVNSGMKPDWPRLEGVGAGMVVTALLMAGRARFLWWPFHPIGYVLAGTFTMPWLWCPTLIGWLLKWCLIRGGGMKLHRAAMPFFLGLILGDYVAGSLWALYGCVSGVPTYRVMPI